MEGSRRWRHVQLWALGALFVGQVVSIYLPERLTIAGIARDSIPFVIPLFASVIAFRAAAQRDPSERLFWILLGAGAAAWGLGDLGFSLYGQLGFDPTGKLTLADAGYLALIPCWGAAFVAHPSRSRRGIDRLGTTVDALVVFGIAATLTVTYVLVPALTGAESVGGAIVNTVYPLGDLALLAVLVSVMAKSASRMRAGDTFVMIAAAVFAIGDITFARLTLVDAYHVGNPVDMTWSLAFICVALGAGRSLGESNADPDERRAMVPVLCLIGMVGIWGLAALAIADHFRNVPLLVGTLFSGVLLVSRLGVLLFDRADLVRSLDDSVKQLQEAHAARERFIATVSHDLRSPLASIAGFAELLREPDVREDAAQVDQMTRSIERNAKRLARLTEDLLCAGQFATGHPPVLKLAALDVRQVAQEVVVDLGRTDRVTVHGSRWIYAMADKQRVQQVLVNLVENAFKHSGSSDVSIGVSVVDAGVAIEVTDHGVGIAPERIDQIFAPFVSDFSKTSSVGLGLYVVNGLIAAMGGTVSVTSAINAGTTFRIVLPPAIPEGALEESTPVAS